MALLQRDLRASDRDRERAVAFLRAHYMEGRIEEHELDWRCDAAYRAVGLRELDGLTADLPALAQPPRRRRVPVLPLTGVALMLSALIFLVPPEVSLALLVLLLTGLLVLGTLLAPLWIPVLLCVLVYKLVRGTRRPPGPPRVGWR